MMRLLLITEDRDGKQYSVHFNMIEKLQFQLLRDC